MMMLNPRNTSTRYLRCAKAGINASSAEKYHKQARAKLWKLSRLPKGL